MRRNSKQARERELVDNARLLKWWKAWHREQRDEALAKHPHLAELFRIFDNLAHVQPAQLIGYAQSVDWSVIDYATKLTVVHEFNAAVTTFRVKRGLEPIDDSLPGEPETPFRTLKAILFPPKWGAHRGVARPE
jgi:hypothetical protein